MGLFDKIFGRPDADKFARTLSQRLKQAGDRREAQYDKEQFQLIFTREGEDAGVANLQNIFSEYCSLTRSQRGGAMQHYVRSLLAVEKEMPDEFEDATPDLYPAVRSRAYYEMASLQMEPAKQSNLTWPHYEIGDFLACSLVYDLPEAMRAIQQDDLDKWGVTFYEALEVAKHNLAETDFAFAAIGESVYASATGDNYDAARLLLLDMLRKLDVTGDYIAMVPNRDSLIITGSEDTEGLGLMCKLASDALDQHHPVSGLALRLEGDDWIPWIPSPDHEHFDQFKLLAVKTLAGEYDEQKGLLDSYHEKIGDDIFVASFSVAQKQDSGELLSYCVWGENLDAMLPATDKVGFVRGETDDPQVVGFGDWDHVQQVVGDLMLAVDTYPPRYRVTDFPTAEQLDQIGIREL